MSRARSNFKKALLGLGLLGFGIGSAIPDENKESTNPTIAVVNIERLALISHSPKKLSPNGSQLPSSLKIATLRVR